jgi:mono/diheme cytochrome c family protein
MPKAVAILLGLVAVAAPAVAQQEDSAARFELGERLFAEHCAVCHGESGAGLAPAFPALRGNERIADVYLIVGNIARGSGAMPAFPHLTAEGIASLGHYIRNAWDNDFGPVSVEEAAAALDGLAPAGDVASIWDGVFTEEQAARGQQIYSGPCGWCHGRRLNGAPDDADMRSTPPLARAKFLRDWNGRSLGILFGYIRATMPESSPGSLTDEEYLDVIAYMLSVSGAPAGDEELLPDADGLARVMIEPNP